jgi:hypothetical protein
VIIDAAANVNLWRYATRSFRSSNVAPKAGVMLPTGEESSNSNDFVEGGMAVKYRLAAVLTMSFIIGFPRPNCGGPQTPAYAFFFRPRRLQVGV